MDNRAEELIKGGDPVLSAMKHELDQAAQGSGDFFGRLERSRDTRFCRWDGQSDDARRHGKNAFPWEGASDTRIRVSDETVNEQVMVLVAAFFRQQIQTIGIGGTNQARSSQITQLVKWMIYGQMLDHLWREVNLAANWRQDPGLAILSIEWEQETRVEMEPLDIEQLQAAAQSPEGEGLADVQEMLLDPLREEEALEMLQALSPMVNVNTGKRILRELREQGHSAVPTPTILKNRPRWVALRPFVDVFFRPQMDDLQREPWICRVEYVTETELRDRVVTMGYSEEFVTEALKHRGPALQQGASYAARYVQDPQFGRVMEDHRNDIELLHMYSKDASEHQQPALYYTVFHYGIACLRGQENLYALHQPHGYDHGQMPFVPLAREHVSRRMIDSRGVSEIAHPWQYEIKVQRDTRSDYTQIATIPPLIVPPGRGEDFPFGPGVNWPGRRGGDPQFAKVPPYNPGSIEMEKAVRGDLDRYFGKMSEIVPPALTQLHQQHMTNGFLIECRLALRQTFQLMQQFLDDTEVQRVVGVTDREFHVSREEIQGQYDFFLDFDVKELDPEFIKEKLKTMRELVLPMDRYGTFDMTVIAAWSMRAIDPQLAAMAIRSQESASEAEELDEKNALALMFSGQEAPMKVGNLNFALRLDVLQRALMSNPELQEALRSRPIFAAMVEQRVKYLRMQISQLKNAETGITGGQAVLADQVR